MAITHLVTGYAGVEHIQSADEGAFNAAFFGNGQYVMESGNMFEGSIVDNNTVRILDGDLLMYGRHIRIKPDAYEDLTITTGTAGTNRIDLICVTYEKNANDGTETAYFEVIKGTETEGTAVAPDYIDGNILEGATKNQMPMYKVTVVGVVLSSIESVFTTIPTYKTLAEKYAAEFLTACETHLDSLNVLDTMEEVLANTQEQQIAGALALKAVQIQHTNDVAEINNTLSSLPDETALLEQTIGYAKKNLLKIADFSFNSKGVTVESTNGIFSIDGTAVSTGNATYSSVGTFTPKVGKKYRFTSGCDTTGIIRITGVNGTADKYYDDYTWVAETADVITVQVLIKTSAVYTNVVASPMIRDARITDNTYESYVDDVDARINAITPTYIAGTMTAGETSIELTSDAITTDSIIDIYTDTYGVNPVAVVVAEGSVTLTFKAQEMDVNVKVKVN